MNAAGVPVAGSCMLRAANLPAPTRATGHLSAGVQSTGFDVILNAALAASVQPSGGAVLLLMRLRYCFQSATEPAVYGAAMLYV